MDFQYIFGPSSPNAIFRNCFGSLFLGIEFNLIPKLNGIYCLRSETYRQKLDPKKLKINRPCSLKCPSHMNTILLIPKDKMA